jgi:hypothetical protein
MDDIERRAVEYLILRGWMVRRKQSPGPSNRMRGHEQEVARRYLAGEGLVSIGRSYGHGAGVVADVLDTVGVPRRRPGARIGNRNALSR